MKDRPRTMSCTMSLDAGAENDPAKIVAIRVIWADGKEQQLARLDRKRCHIAGAGESYRAQRESGKPVEV